MWAPDWVAERDHSWAFMWSGRRSPRIPNGYRATGKTVASARNYVRIRVERESHILVDDIAALQGLLSEWRVYHERADDKAWAAIIGKAQGTLPVPNVARYRSLNDLAADDAIQREALHGTLASLQALRATRGADLGYVAAREAMGAYTVRPIEQEGEIVGLPSSAAVRNAERSREARRSVK